MEKLKQAELLINEEIIELEKRKEQLINVIMLLKDE